MQSKGKFITLEGCEGVGKSTQTRFLKEYCIKNSILAFFTREPGGTDIAEKIRHIVLDADNKDMDSITELLLYIASRRQHTEKLIKEKLEQGCIVFCDRYIDSTMAYQGYARGLDKDMIAKLNEWAMGDTKIDYTIFMNVSPRDGFSRKGGVDKSDRLELEGVEFHKKVYEGFCAIASNEPKRVINIVASGTKFETHDKIVKALKERGVF